MKKCPYCAEEIQNVAIVCRYCGRDLKPSETPPEQALISEAPEKIDKPKSNKTKIVMGVVGGVILATCACLAIAIIFSPSKLKPAQVLQPTNAQPVRLMETNTPEPTPTSEPSATPEPTLTQAPTATTDILAARKAYAAKIVPITDQCTTALTGFRDTASELSGNTMGFLSRDWQDRMSSKLDIVETCGAALKGLKDEPEEFNKTIDSLNASGQEFQLMVSDFRTALRFIQSKAYTDALTYINKSNVHMVTATGYLNDALEVFPGR